MSAAPDCSPGWMATPPASLATLLAAAGAAVERLAGAELGMMADGEPVAVMDTLTTLIARLDGLRAGVAQVVADRGLYGQRGARNLAGWLRADARLADDAWKLARLAAAAPRLPRITGLLGAGAVSLSQAATACWQITQLPDVPCPPGEGAAPDVPCPPGEGEPPGEAGDPGRPGVPGGPDAPAADRRGWDGSSPDGRAASEDRWAGLWRLGDVHAAADELFSAVLPGLDSGQVRQLGAHLREAADAQQRAGEDSGDFAARGLRISRSLAGCGEITGRLHAEAAEQVIAAFEDLGGKTGPDDTRTKAQRWADVLTRLCATAGMPPAAPPAGPRPGPAHEGPAHEGPAHEGPAHDGTGPAPADDQPCPAGTGHSHPSGQAGCREAKGGAEPAGPGQRAGDGAAASAYEAPVPAGYQRPRLIVTVPLATLLGQPLSPGATVLGPGTALTGQAARRLACDAEIIRLITGPQPAGRSGGGHPGSSHPGSSHPGSGHPGSGQPGGGHPGSGHPGGGGHDGCGRPGGSSGNATRDLTGHLAVSIARLPPPLAGPSALLDIGRKSPGWTPRQRDALCAQYGGHCAHPGCTGPVDVIHHITHWAEGGPTSVGNGYPCCLYHHWLIHEGGWRIRKHPDGTVTAIPPPRGWRPGTIYRRGKPLPEDVTRPHTSRDSP